MLQHHTGALETKLKSVSRIYVCHNGFFLIKWNHADRSGWYWQECTKQRIPRFCEKEVNQSEISVWIDQLRYVGSIFLEIKNPEESVFFFYLSLLWENTTHTHSFLFLRLHTQLRTQSRLNYWPPAGSGSAVILSHPVHANRGEEQREGWACDYPSLCGGKDC